MIISSIWYNLFLQYYYIVHLKSIKPSLDINDKYFTGVYYTTMALDEVAFCQLLFMYYVIHKFVKR